jgi:hypothetical protein
MRLGDNLRKDPQGHWCIIFQSEQLKIARKRGKDNILNLAFPLPLIPILEDYLTLWRPILLAKAGHPDTHVSLTQYGTPYRKSILNRTTSTIVYKIMYYPQSG